MKKIILLTGLLTLTMVLTACGSGSSSGTSPSTSPSKSTEKPVDPLVLGQTVFEKNCSGCHSAGAEQRVGPPLAGISKSNLKTTGQPATKENLREFIKKGTSSMPGNLVKSEAELDTLLQYLESL